MTEENFAHPDMTNRHLPEHRREWVPLMEREWMVGSDSDQSEYVGSGGPPCWNPSGVFLVADPSFLPIKVVERLLAPDANGRVGAMLANRQFTRFMPYANDSRLKLIFNNMQVHEACAFCGRDIRTRALEVFWDGRAVCDCCMPIEMSLMREIGYEWAKEISAEPDGSPVRHDDPLIEFADRHSPKESS